MQPRSETPNPNPHTYLCTTCPIFKRLGGCSVVRPFVTPTKAPKYLFIGEAPGHKEAQDGVPFTGKAGEILRECADLAKIGVENETIVCNAVLCPPRPAPGQKTISATPEEVINCLAHGLSYVLYRPKVIIVLGATPYRVMSGKMKGSISADRGQWFDMKPPFSVRYGVFRRWVDVYKAQKIKTEEHRLFYLSQLDPATNLSACEEQVSRAKAELGYSEEWMKIPCMGILHPAAVLHQGTHGQHYENMKLDLEKASNYVNGVLTTTAKKDYQWINSLDELESYVDETIQMFRDKRIKMIAGDTETERGKQKAVGLLAYDPSVDIVSIQFSRFDHEGRGILLQHRASKVNDPVSMQMVVHHLTRLLQSVPSVWHNGTFDYNVIRCRLGIKDWKLCGDTMLMDHWCFAGRNLFYNLDDVGARYCGTGKHKSDAKDWMKAHPGKYFEDMPLPIALDYACGDVDVTRRVYWHLRRFMENPTANGGDLEKGLPPLWANYHRHFYTQHKAWQVIADLEWSGMPVDKETLDHLKEEYPKRLEECHHELMQIPKMQDLWMRPRYQLEVDDLVALNAVIEEEHAAGKKRRRIRKIPTFADWSAVKKNWFNPNSSPQTFSLWFEILRLPLYVGPKQELFFEDLEFSDEDCSKCHRSSSRCRCAVHHLPQKPKSNSHNRKMIVDRLEQRLKEGNLTEHVEANIQDALVIVKAISRYKKLSKLNSTYVQGIYPLIPDAPGPDEPWDPKERCNPVYRAICDWPDPWMIHPQYKMNGTETGRLSSADPNGQNFPGKGDDKDTNVKLPYVSRWSAARSSMGAISPPLCGGLLLQPDYSQIEVRVMVVACGDEKMTKVLNEGKDIHTFVATIVHNLPEEKITPELRKPVKSITFGIMYGQSAASLAQALHIPVAEAQHIMDTLFAQFPKIKELVDTQHMRVRQHQRVLTRLGRVRWLHHIDDENIGQQNKALRDSVNTPIQSMASDLCWQSYGRCWEDIKRLRIPAHPFGIIHDSQTFDVGPGWFFDLLELQYYQMVWKTMDIYKWMTVKPEVEFSIGTRWGNLIDLKLCKEGDEMDHNHFDLKGLKEYVEEVQSTMVDGGMKVEVKEDGPDPNPDAAKKGAWIRKLWVDRSDGRIFNRGRELEIVSR